jgi:outer membrane protein assembly factor BamB
MRNLCSAAIVMCLVIAVSQAIGEDQNWPQWRGPAGTGVSSTMGVVSQWGPGQNVKWRIELPEPGNSTPIVWEDRLLFTQPLSEAKQRSLFCVDRETGRELWRRGVTYDQPESSHKTNPYCSASPVTDGERVIAWFGSAGLVCWDLAGNEMWRRDLGAQEHMWGYGSSPILHEDLCILLFGPGNNEFLVAVDKTTGQTRWKVGALDNEAERALSGPENDGGSHDFSSEKQRSERLRGAWSTPIVIEVNGHSELVATLPRRVSAFDPLTGERLWTCGGAAPLAYASPMEWDGVIVALGGYGGASLAVRAGGRGDVTRTHRLWQKPRDSGWLGTGVAHDGLIYACSMSGVLSCMKVQTGEVLWNNRIRGGGSWSSITQTGDGRMFLLTKSATTTVFQPDSKELKRLSENALNETTNASVVVAGNDVLIRTDKALWRITGHSPEGQPTIPAKQSSDSE